MKFKKLASVASIAIISSSLLIGCSSGNANTTTPSGNTQISEESSKGLVNSATDVKDAVDNETEKTPSGEDKSISANVGDDVFNKINTDQMKKKVAKTTVQAKSKSKDAPNIVVKKTPNGAKTSEDSATVDSVKNYLADKYKSEFSVDELSSFYVDGNDKASGQVTLACPNQDLNKIFTVWYVDGEYYDSYESLAKETQVDASLQAQLNRYVSDAKVMDFYTQILYSSIDINTTELILNSKCVYHDLVLVTSDYENDKDNLQEFIGTLSRNSNYHVYIYEDKNPEKVTRSDYQDFENKSNIKYDVNLADIDL